MEPSYTIVTPYNMGWQRLVGVLLYHNILTPYIPISGWPAVLNM